MRHTRFLITYKLSKLILINYTKIRIWFKHFVTTIMVNIKKSNTMLEESVSIQIEDDKSSYEKYCPNSDSCSSTIWMKLLQIVSFCSNLKNFFIII